MKIDAEFSIDEVINNLNKQIKKIDNVTMAGLLEAGLIVERISKQGSPLKVGNLKGSGYSRKALDGSLAVEIGHYASYAPYVHELGPRQGGPGRKKFLEKALVEADVIGILTKHSKRSMR